MMSVRMRFVHGVYCLFILYTALCTHVHVYILKIQANEGVVLCTKKISNGVDQVQFS